MIELSDEYLPKEILHRDEQISKIRETFQNFKKNKTGTNILLLGVTGSGKTTIIKKVMTEENSSIYVSCDETQTSYKTLKAFCNINAKTYSQLMELTVRMLKDKPKILIIDEIDKISRADDFQRLMSALNTIYRKTMVPIILVTLKRDITSSMASDARKTLLFEKINLPAYNALELQNILRSRLKQLKEKIEIGDGVLNYIAALAAQQGSARILMNILLRCIQKNNYQFEFIDEIYKQLMREDWLDFVNDINQTEKEFLRNLLNRCDSDNPVSAEILEKDIGLSGARISQLINTFEKYACITSWHENLGRAGGRKRYIKFATPEIYNELNKLMGNE